MIFKLRGELIDLIKETAKTIEKDTKRSFIAQCTNAFCNGNPNNAQTMFGWNRDSVQTALDEYISGVPIPFKTSTGRKKSEDKLPMLAYDVKEALSYIHLDKHIPLKKISTQKVYNYLILIKNYNPDAMPCAATLHRIITRLRNNQYEVLQERIIP
jgi:hypothetical protein